MTVAMGRPLQLFLACVVIGLGVSPAKAGDQEWGTVEGRIVLDAAEAPQPRVINVAGNADSQHCSSKGPLLSEELVVNPKNMGVRWVFVWLAPSEKDGKLPIHKDLAKPKAKQVELDQPCCAFVPHALALREGQEIVVNNTSPVAHNINWSGFKNPGGNTIVPSKKSYTITDLKADRFPVSLTCNLHGWMKGWVRIFDHPYFAITNADGTFEIKNAPAGPVQLVVWHESGWGPGGKQGTPINIKGGQVVDLGVLKMQPPK